MSGRLSRAALGAVLALALAAAACGADKDGVAAADKPTNPCPLVKPAEVQQLLKESAEGKPVLDDALGPMCTWTSNAGDRALTLQLASLYLTDHSGDGRGYNWDRESFDGWASDMTSPVAGLGDSAHLGGLPQIGDKGPVTKLYVLHHKERAFILIMQMPIVDRRDQLNNDQVGELLRPLATAIIARQ